MMGINLSQRARKVSGVPAAQEPVNLVRMAVCVINTMGPVIALQDSWEDSVRAVSNGILWEISIATCLRQPTRPGRYTGNY